MKNLTITISVEELNALTTAAIKADRIIPLLKTTEASCSRKRAELHTLQAKYEELKAKYDDLTDTIKDLIAAIDGETCYKSIFEVINKGGVVCLDNDDPKDAFLLKMQNAFLVIKAKIEDACASIGNN